MVFSLNMLWNIFRLKMAKDLRVRYIVFSVWAAASELSYLTPNSCYDDILKHRMRWSRGVALAEEHQWRS